MLQMYHWFVAVLLLVLCAAGEWDVVVYDGSSGGVMAAVAAAQAGKHVALLCASWPSCFKEGGFVLGGMSASGLGESDIASDPEVTIGGLAYEFYRRNRAEYSTKASSLGDSSHLNDCRLPSLRCNVTYNLEPHVAGKVFHDMLTEAGVDIFYETQVAHVVKSNDTHIENLVTVDGRNFRGSVFVDASYEGDLLKCGWSFICNWQRVAPCL